MTSRPKIRSNKIQTLACQQGGIRAVRFNGKFGHFFDVKYCDFLFQVMCVFNLCFNCVWKSLQLMENIV